MAKGFALAHCHGKNVDNVDNVDKPPKCPKPAGSNVDVYVEMLKMAEST